MTQARKVSCDLSGVEWENTVFEAFSRHNAASETKQEQRTDDRWLILIGFDLFLVGGLFS